MTRLPLFALILAGSAVAMPAAAQQQTVDAEKINQVIVYGNDQCEQSSPDEIVVCNRLPGTERYRLPEMLRGNPLALLELSSALSADQPSPHKQPSQASEGR